MLNKTLSLLTLILISPALCFAASTTSCYDVDDTSLMLHMDGTDESTTFTDSDNGAKSITANGHAQIDTAKSQFGGASGKFDGTGDWLSFADTDDIHFDTGAFTIDFWVYFADVSASRSFLYQRQDATNEIVFFWNAAGTLDFTVQDAGSNVIAVSNAWSPSIDVWYHVTLLRTGNDFKMYVDGAQIGSTATDASAVSNKTGAIGIGGRGDTGALPMHGWLDEYRIVKGVAIVPPSGGPSSAYTDCDAVRRRVVLMGGGN